MGLLAVSDAHFVAWACFVIGLITFAAGVCIGLWTSFSRAPAAAEQAKTKLEEARKHIDDAKQHIAVTSSVAASANLESATESAAQASQAADAAGDSTEAAKSALEQVQGILSALPENLRFAGLLILVGTALMGVATVQFGGVSLF
jgi:hypothetical protein